MCKTSLGFEAVSVAFNPQDEQQLLVSGLKDCVVLTLGARGEVVSRLVVDLLLDSLGLNTPVHLIKSGWLPNSASQCFVLTNQFLKIYDLARDKISPIHYFQTLDDAIKDVAFVHAERLLPPPGSSGAAGGGGLVLLAISAAGIIYTQALHASDSTNGPHILTDALQVSPDLRGRVGAHLHYSAPCSLLFTVYADGRCYALRLNDNAAGVLGGFAVQGTRIDSLSSSGALSGSKSACTPYSHWQDVPGQRGMLIACCRKTLIPLALRVTTSGIEVQVLKPHAKAEGVCAASSHRRGDGWTDGPAVCWALLEDGSTQCYMCGHMEDSEAAFSAALGRAYAKQPSSRAPSFPVDFFERSTCVTANPEITLGGDVTHNSTAANAKARLSSNTDDYVSSPHKASLTLHVNNSSTDHVLVGLRFLLGSAHPQHVPASFTLFNRTITTQEGQRRWYDVPFTETEAVIGQKQVTIVFSATHTGANVPVLDAVDVYAQSKADFGWDAQVSSLTDKYKIATTPPVSPRAEDLAAQEPMATTLRALECSLRQLATFYAAVGGSADSAADSATHKEMLRVIPAVLTAGASCASLRSPAKLLLRQLLPETESYLALKDEALLRHAASIIGGSAAAAQQEPSLIVPTAIAPPAAITAVTTSSLSHLLASVQRVVRKRPHNLFAFLRVEPNFFNQLAATFRSVQAPAMRLSKLPTLTRSFVQLLLSCAEQHVATACSDATAESQPADVVRPYFQLLSSLLLHTNQTIRFASSGAITALLFAATSAYDASPYAAEPSLDFSKPYSARPSSSGAGGSSAGIDASEAAMGGGMGGANDEEDPMELDEAETADEGSLLVEKVPPLLADASGAGASSSGAIQFRCDVCQMCPITSAAALRDVPRF